MGIKYGFCCLTNELSRKSQSFSRTLTLLRVWASSAESLGLSLHGRSKFSLFVAIISAVLVSGKWREIKRRETEKPGKNPLLFFPFTSLHRLHPLNA